MGSVVVWNCAEGVKVVVLEEKRERESYSRMIRICARLESVLRLTEEDEEVDGEDVSSSSRTTVAVTCRRVVQELVVVS